jgi:hypothetical protein
MQYAACRKGKDLLEKRDNYNTDQVTQANSDFASIRPQFGGREICFSLTSGTSSRTIQNVRGVERYSFFQQVAI